MRYLILASFLLPWKAWSLEPILEIEELGNIGSISYVNYKVQCPTGDTAPIIFWEFEDQSTIYCVGNHADHTICEASLEDIARAACLSIREISATTEPLEPPR